MATFRVKGLDDFVKQLTELEQNADKVINEAVYKGAGVLADAVREEIENLPEHENGTPGGVKEYERQAMLEGMGIAPVQADGDGLLNAKVGFDGYYAMSDGSKKPIPMIARSINSGTSFSQKQPFVRKAVRGKRTEVEKAMQEVFENEVNKIMNKK